LLRARAIENQCHVIAPGQWGHHGGRRRSFGHSCIIDPWGTILAEVPDGTGYAIARIDPERTRRVRSQLPALEHRRHSVVKEVPCIQD
jgi:nitrilase